MAAQKCENILLQAILKDFSSSSNPKLKTKIFVKSLWELLLSTSNLKCCSTVNF